MKIVIEIPDTIKRLADEDDVFKFSNLVWVRWLKDSIKEGTLLTEVLEEIKGEIRKRFWEDDAENIISIIDSHIGKEQR